MDPQDDHDNKKLAHSDPIYRHLPLSFKCENCDYTGYTIVEQRTTYISYILMILFIFIFGIYFSIILTPLVILLTRSFYHKCPSCFKEVGSDNKLLSIWNMTDKVMSFSIGEFGIVLSRKIVFGVFLTLVLILTIYIRLSTHHHHHGPMDPIYESWPNYVKECGIDALHAEPTKLGHCEHKYVNKAVMNWSGYVIRVDDYRNAFYSFLPHAMVLFIRMEPHESELLVDLSLAVDSEKAVEFNDVILGLNRGSEIIFNATVITVGDPNNQRHFHIHDLKAGKGFKEIAPLIHERGRYSEHGKSFRGDRPQNPSNELPAK